MLANVIETLIYGSVGIGLIKSYLTINKLWSRKGDLKVANSISVYAAMLGVLATLPFFIKYAFMDADYKSAANAFIGLLVGTFFILIGSGFWVRNKITPLSFWAKFKRSLRLENNEAADLVKAFILPKGADLIIKILHQMALIDQKIDNREIKFIEMFANSWHLKFDPKNIVQTEKGNSQDSNYIDLQNSIESYIKLTPPIKQAAQLRDVITSLSNADNEVTEEESFILVEINGMLDNYIDENEHLTRFEVVIAPQNDDQKDIVKKLMPNFILSEKEGGVGYRVGSYYSEKMARMICKKYRSLNLFTAIEKVEDK